MDKASSPVRVQLQQPESIPPISTTSVSAACLACRSRHLKCDAGIPACQRCRQNNRECVYVKSRRGWKATTTKDSGSAITGTTKRRIESEDGLSFDSFSSGQSTSSNMSPTTSSVQNDPVPSLVDLFYCFFHNSHPIMIPREFYGLLLSSSYDRETQDIINNLLVPVIHYIGSIYIKGAKRVRYKQAVEKAIFGEPADITGPGHRQQFIVPTSPISVMAMLLYSIVIHGESQQCMSMFVKDHAVDMALCLNMHDVAFLDSYVDNAYFDRQPVFLGVLKESLRRTFWMLFVMDGWMNALHRRPPSALMNVVPTMDLPCEDEEYNVGNIPVPHTLKELDNRAFASQPPQFSSFSYLIDAIRIMGLVMATMAQSSQASVAEAAELADTTTSVWFLQIPYAKKSLLRPVSNWPPGHSEHLHLKGGGDSLEVDELMTHAVIIINSFLIVVHKPLSRLGLAPCDYEEHESYCVTPRSLLISFRANLSTDNQNMACGSPETNSSLWDHTLKCMSSADKLSRLICLSPGTVNRRSPFFTCSVTLSLVIHLTACVWVFYSSSAEKQRAMVKERIKLGIGALQAMSETWSTAQHVLEKVQEAARIVFEQHRSADNFLRALVNAAKRLETMQSSAPGIMNPEPMLKSTKSSSGGTIMPSDTDTGIPGLGNETDVLPMDWAYIQHLEPSIGSEADTYSGSDSTAGYSPSLNLDSSVLLEGSQDQSQQHQLDPSQSYPMLSELDRSILRHVQMLPEPIISEDELLDMIDEPDLVELYKRSAPISFSVNLGTQLF
ncbi:hypothetical protein V1525DRAFT_404438, partial [Lipomyces kononenkoae]